MPRKDMLPILVDSWYTRAHITKDDTSIIYSNINLTMIRKKMNEKTFWQPYLRQEKLKLIGNGFLRDM